MVALNNTRVAILATNGFEQSELTSPRDALKEAGALVDVIAPNPGEIRGWSEDNWSDTVAVDKTLRDANAADYAALILPGGVLNPDQLRVNEKAIAFIRHFVDCGKVVAAICHGPWSLINAGAVLGLNMTSYDSIRKDLENAGAHWTDEEVVVDKGIITSRKPDDLPAFNTKIIEELQNGIQRRLVS